MNKTIILSIMFLNFPLASAMTAEKSYLLSPLPEALEEKFVTLDSVSIPIKHLPIEFKEDPNFDINLEQLKVLMANLPKGWQQLIAKTLSNIYIAHKLSDSHSLSRNLTLIEDSFIEELLEAGPYGKKFYGNIKRMDNNYLLSVLYYFERALSQCIVVLDFIKISPAYVIIADHILMHYMRKGHSDESPENPIRQDTRALLTRAWITNEWYLALQNKPEAYRDAQNRVWSRAMKNETYSVFGALAIQMVMVSTVIPFLGLILVDSIHSFFATPKDKDESFPEPFYFSDADNNKIGVSADIVAPATVAEFQQSFVQPCALPLAPRDLFKICMLARERSALIGLGKTTEQMHAYFIKHYSSDIFNTLENINGQSAREVLVFYSALRRFALNEFCALIDSMNNALYRADRNSTGSLSLTHAETFQEWMEREPFTQRSRLTFLRLIAKRWNLSLQENLNNAIARANGQSLTPGRALTGEIFLPNENDEETSTLSKLTLADLIRSYIETSTNPSKESKRTTALNFLKVSRPDAFQEGVIDQRSWEDLELFCGGRGTEDNYLCQHLPTFTEMGHVFMMRAVANASANPIKLNRRQQQISALDKSPELESMKAIFMKIGEVESGIFSFWDTNNQITAQLRNYVFTMADLDERVPCIKDTCDWLNSNENCLEVLNRYLLLENIESSTIMRLFSNFFGLDALRAYRNYIRPQNAQPLTAASKKTEAGGIVSQAFSQKQKLSSALSQGQSIASSAKKGLVVFDAEEEDRFSVFLGEFAPNVVFMTFSMVALRIQMMRVAEMFKKAEELREILVRHNTGNLFDSFIQRLDYRNYSSEIRELRNVLVQNTFRGSCCFPKQSAEALPIFKCCLGRIVGAYRSTNKHKSQLIPLLSALADFDVLLSSARLVNESKHSPNKFCIPNFLINPSLPVINIAGSWNPFLAKIITEGDQAQTSCVHGETQDEECLEDANSSPISSYIKSIQEIITNDLSVEPAHDKHSSVIISGPNAGGKTSIMKGILFGVILAQGLGIAPAESLSLTPFSTIRAYLNIVDNQVKGESLFKAAVTRGWEVYRSVADMKESSFSLCVFDELFNGTSTVEGEAAAVTLLQELGHKRNNLTLATSHFDGLKALSTSDDHFVNYKVTVDELENGKLRYPFKLTKGTTDQQIAFKILRNQGFDAQFIENCKKMALKLQQNRNVTGQNKGAETFEDSSSDEESNQDKDSHKGKRVSKPSSTLAIRPLRNFGATCYVNTVLQMMATLRVLNQQILMMKESFVANSVGCAYLDFIKAYADNDMSHMNEFCKRTLQELRRTVNSHEDANEYFTWLMSQLCDASIKKGPQVMNYAGTIVPRTALSQLCFSEIDSQFSLESNAPGSSKKDWCSHLDLHITGDSLQNCLDKFFELERLVISNRGPGSKQLKAIQLPHYLFLHIKRTVLINGILQRDSRSLSFPTNKLTVAQGQEKINYKLVAFAVHSGSAQVGHYKAYVCRGDTWFECNDMLITPVSSIEKIAEQGRTLSFVPTCFIYEKVGSPA